MIVYFAQRTDGAIKIGAASTGSSSIQRALASYIRAKAKGGRGELARTPGYLVVERWFHWRHAEACVGGEWFDPTPRLLRDIATICRDGRVAGQPAEPPRDMVFPGRVARTIRVAVLGKSVDEMASLTRLGLSTVAYDERDEAEASMTRAVNYEYAAQLCGVMLTVADIVKMIDGREVALPRFAAYRTHVVRSIGDGARA